ncbi:MAG: tetratricopeptide repeat protein [Lachnospiraceae bacterium]|nr:tetratricopeptide repeat protein [Lachnospiraceae bacterium]
MKKKLAKKRVTMRTMVAGMLASAMLLGNIATVFAADAAELWNAGKSEEEQGFHYKANELYDQAYELIQEGGGTDAIFEQKIKSMFNAKEYWYVEKYYFEAVELGCADNYMASIYGDALVSCKQYDKAIEIYKDILNSYGDEDPIRATYLRAIGDCYKNLGMTDKAAQAYEEMCAVDGDVDYYREKMAALELEWKLSDVETIVSNYLSGYTYEEIVDTLSDYDYYEEALQYCEKAENEEGADLRSLKADTYYSMGLAKEAASLYEEILLENPTDTASMNKLGAIYCDGLGQYEDAKELFEKVVALNPEANGTKGNLAVVARKSGKLDEVSDIYREVIQMDDTYLKAYNYTIMYRKDITAEEALQILSEYPGWPQTKEMQALMLSDSIDTSYMTQTTLESYLSYFLGCLEEDGDNYYYLQTVGSLLCGLGRYEEALPYYKKALNQAGILSYYANNGLGNCYYYNQDYEMAVAMYENNFKEAHARVSILNMAECYIQSGQYDQARTEIDYYLSEGGTDDVAYYYMLIAYQEEDYEALLNYADQYLKEAPDSLKAKAYKAAALTALGMEGADEVIADIDSIQYAYEDTDLLIAESILGRFDKAREIYQYLLDNCPSSAREIVHDCELKNLLTDEQFCEMAGIKVLNEEVTETVGQSAEQESEEGFAGNTIWAVAGVGVVVILIGVVSALIIRRKKAE